MTAGAAERDETRRKLVDAALNSWISQLVDLGATNRLLYYRTLKTGSLELDRARQPRVEELRQGSTLRIGLLFPGGSLLADAARRMRAIAAKALENFEERGIRTLYLARGVATWQPVGTGAVPAAPILLFPLSARRCDATGEDFYLHVDGDPEINPALLQLMRSRHQVVIDGDALVDQATEGRSEPDERLVYNSIYQACSALNGFAISDRQLIGNFSFAKLPMVNDLAVSRAAAAHHPFILALAGDVEARSQLSRADPIPLDLPDRLPPNQDHLVFDADASQSHAIHRVLAGESITIQGPPGTGKSQTIANMIVSLAAEGKRVLFVAEKRAAIDAVVKRLTSAGLRDIVFDLHSNGIAKSAFARGLLQAASPYDESPPESHDVHDSLSALRESLQRHNALMHDVRPPWNISLYDLQSDMYGYSERVHSDVVIPLDRATEIDRTTFRTLAELVREHTAIRQDTEPTRWERATLSTQTDAQIAVETATMVAGSDIPHIDGSLRRLAYTLGLRAPATPRGWGPVVELLHASTRVFQAFRPTLYEDGHDLTWLREQLAAADRTGLMGALIHALSGSYRRARSTSRRLLREGIELDDAQLYRGIATAEDVLRRWHEMSERESVPRPINDVDRLVQLHNEMSERIADLLSFLPKLGLADLDPDSLTETLHILSADSRGAYAQPRLRAIESELERFALLPVLDFIRERELSPGEGVDALRFTWLRSIYSAFAPELASFNVDVHDSKCRDFRRADHAQQQLNVARAREAVRSNIAALRFRHPDQMQLVESQAARSRAHLVPRDLIARSPDVVTALRPCWTMSPLLVAQLLPLGLRLFDIVIFDEASQLRPADAAVCMLRAPQAVLAGDSEQLPPTRFFATDVDDDFESEDLPPSALVTGVESALDAANAILKPSFLRWHYRSRDERLVAFSNAQFYANSLITFPSTLAGHANTRSGMNHVIVPSRSDEVHVVAERVLEHARTRPDRSLGVIAMGIEHAQRIVEALRRARVNVADAELIDDFFDETRPERFFVKNLETVQGDERDHVIITIGFEKNETGQLSHRFGPLNQAGGERRLNVAITRAREQLTLVSAFGPGDIDLERSSARAVELLRDYMLYIESGCDLQRLAPPPAPLDPFLQHMQTWLQALGVPCTPLYGQSSDRIDFALPHPKDPSRFVLAVETDGPRYAACPTTRERDRLRPEVLARLGWAHHRVWSAAWYRDPRHEAERIKAAWLASAGA